MNYTIFILEDDKLQANCLIKLIQDYGVQHNIVFHIFFADSLQKAYKMIYKHIDIFLLDIALSKDEYNQDGFVFANMLQSQPGNQIKPILFITAHEIHMPIAINQFHCFSFLTKPYECEDFFSQLDDLFMRIKYSLTDNSCATKSFINTSLINESSTNRQLLIKKLDGTYVPLFLNHLIYITSHGRYLTYVTTKERFQSRQYTMKKIEQLLESPFVRCHKSYIINQTYIKNYDFLLHYAHLVNSKDLIPLSRKFHL